MLAFLAPHITLINKFKAHINFLDCIASHWKFTIGLAGMATYSPSHGHPGALPQCLMTLLSITFKHTLPNHLNCMYKGKKKLIRGKSACHRFKNLQTTQPIRMSQLYHIVGKGNLGWSKAASVILHISVLLFLVSSACMCSGCSFIHRCHGSVCSRHMTQTASLRFCL